MKSINFPAQTRNEIGLFLEKTDQHNTSYIGNKNTGVILDRPALSKRAERLKDELAAEVSEIVADNRKHWWLNNGWNFK